MSGRRVPCASPTHRASALHIPHATADLFKKADALTAGKEASALPILAEAIKQPDEIWLVWRSVNGKMALHRRYLKRVKIIGQDTLGMAVFEDGVDGWLGASLLQTDEAYVEALRGGFLLYRRQG